LEAALYPQKDLYVDPSWWHVNYSRNY